MVSSGHVMWNEDLTANCRREQDGVKRVEHEPTSASHIVWGSDATNVREADLKHTVPALILNTGATMFWAALYERAFGLAAERGEIAKALLGAGAVTALA
jgi:hypothetical protein